jgi:osmotically-inducible protein OsmY
MNSNKSEDNRKKANSDSPGNENTERDGDYGGSDYGRAENVNEEWQAGATEYDVNYREQGFSSSGQSEKNSFDASRESERYRNRGREEESMGVEKVPHPSDAPNTDELIQEEVYMLLRHQADIDPSNIELTVKNGEVLLEGSVRAPLDLRRLDEAIQMVAGVQKVQNRVRVLEDSPAVEGIEYGTNARGKTGMSDQSTGESETDYSGQGTGQGNRQDTKNS